MNLKKLSIVLTLIMTAGITSNAFSMYKSQISKRTWRKLQKEMVYFPAEDNSTCCSHGNGWYHHNGQPFPKTGAPGANTMVAAGSASSSPAEKNNQKDKDAGAATPNSTCTQQASK